MDRTSYTDACRRSRLSRQRLLDSDLSGQARAWRLWAACNELTTGYSKSSDRVHVRTVASYADVPANRASQLLREFDRLGIFIWRKDVRSHSKGFLALPSWVEPDAVSKPEPKADPTCSECGGQIDYPVDGADTEDFVCLSCWNAR
jgi:hypothetical protein